MRGRLFLELAAAHALYRAGSRKECLDAYAKAGAVEGLTEAERRYVSVYRRSATVFSKGGGEIAADYSDADEFFAPQAYWHVDAANGIWCKGDKDIKACSLRWSVPLPGEHVVVFELERRYTDANFNRAYLRIRGLSPRSRALLRNLLRIYAKSLKGFLHTVQGCVRFLDCLLKFRVKDEKVLSRAFVTISYMNHHSSIYEFLLIHI